MRGLAAQPRTLNRQPAERESEKAAHATPSQRAIHCLLTLPRYPRKGFWPFTIDVGLVTEVGRVGRSCRLLARPWGAGQTLRGGIPWRLDQPVKAGPAVGPCAKFLPPFGESGGCRGPPFGRLGAATVGGKGALEVEEDRVPQQVGRGSPHHDRESDSIAPATRTEAAAAWKEVKEQAMMVPGA